MLISEAKYINKKYQMWVSLCSPQTGENKDLNYFLRSYQFSAHCFCTYTCNLSSSSLSACARSCVFINIFADTASPVRHVSWSFNMHLYMPMSRLWCFLTSVKGKNFYIGEHFTFIALKFIHLAEDYIQSGLRVTLKAIQAQSYAVNTS